MRTRITLADGVVTAGLVLCALLPIGWEFVGPGADTAAHFLGGANTTVLFGLLLWPLLKSPKTLAIRAILAISFSIALWAGIEIVQNRIPHHGPEMSDFIADVQGANVGLIMFLVLEWIIAKTERLRVQF